MKPLKIGILGATGVVGRAILECIEQLSLPFSKLKLFASCYSEGKAVHFLGNDYIIESLNYDALSELDVLFGAVNSKLSKEYIELIQKSDVVYIDNSSAFRLDEKVPLIVPEINIDDASLSSNIISNPNCSTILTLMAASPIYHLFGIKKMIVSTYQAVSGAGMNAIDELVDQLSCFPDEPKSTRVFHQPIVNNCIALIGEMMNNGFTNEELKMENEARKILHDNQLEVICTCVRVPVLRSHCISLYCETEREIDLTKLMKRYRTTKGLDISHELPSPYTSSKQYDVQIGRIRLDPHSKKGISLWICGDQIYKGAALNAVQIVQSLLLK